MKIHSDTPTEDVQIQIMPLIDVIFCILVFFILAALQLTRQQGISVDLPKASTGAPQMRDMVVVTIDASGQQFVDKQPINPAQLRSLLRDYQQKNPRGMLVLNASSGRAYSEVVQVLDTMRSVGGDRVALSTAPTNANQLPEANSVPNSTGRPTDPRATPSISPFPLYGTPSPYSPSNPGQSAPPGQNPSNSNPLSPGALPNSLPGSGTQRP
ncbi:MAG TPA: biopolymer transporter ExbD [Thermosynechococcaceae cyanobacterium]